MNNLVRTAMQGNFADTIRKYNRNGILNASIRIGKTRIALLTINDDETVLVVYPNIKIKDRWIEDNKKFNLNKNLEFITTASMKKLVAKGLIFKYILADEIHKYSPAQIKTLKSLSCGSILGISGSLKFETLNKLNLELGLKTLVNYSLENAIKDNLVKDYEIYIHRIDMNLEEKITYTKASNIMKHYSDMIKSNNNPINKKSWELIFKRNMGIRTNFIYNSKTLLQYSNKLIELYKNKKVLIFTLRTDVADELSDGSYHNKNKNDVYFEDFRLSDSGHLSTVNMISEGVTIHNLNNIVCHTVDSNAETFIQKIGRGLQLDDSTNDKCRIDVVVLKDTVQEIWLEKACETLNQFKINYVEKDKTLTKIEHLKLAYPNKVLYIYEKNNSFVYEGDLIENFSGKLVQGYRFLGSSKDYLLNSKFIKKNMITEEEVYKILESEVVDSSNLIKLIQRYLFDVKGVEIIVNPPNNLLAFQLMHVAHNNIYIYYMNKKQKTKND